MERHRCKLCNRRFANGRALGGHMRSHVTSTSSSSSFSAILENPIKTSPLAHAESDAESSPMIASAEPVSCVTDSSPDEDVALCLMMLSRDTWSQEPVTVRKRTVQFYEADEEEELMDGFGTIQKRRRTRYQCGSCRKVFRSYQALGGHRASHKREGIQCVPRDGMRVSGKVNGIEGDCAVKVFECPYCDRVFGSGQALGGHKRSHISAASPANSHSKSQLDIDLNVPASLEEETELSAMSFTTEFAASK